MAYFLVMNFSMFEVGVVLSPVKLGLWLWFRFFLVVVVGTRVRGRRMRVGMVEGNWNVRI